MEMEQIVTLKIEKIEDLKFNMKKEMTFRRKNVLIYEFSLKCAPIQKVRCSLEIENNIRRRYI